MNAWLAYYVCFAWCFGERVVAICCIYNNVFVKLLLLLSDLLQKIAHLESKTNNLFQLITSWICFCCFLQMCFTVLPSKDYEWMLPFYIASLIASHQTILQNKRISIEAIQFHRAFHRLKITKPTCQSLDHQGKGKDYLRVASSKSNTSLIEKPRNAFRQKNFQNF